MQITEVYRFDKETREYKGKGAANISKDGTVLLPPYHTEVAPPAVYKEHEEIPIWNGSEWELVEDHRKHLDSTGTPAGGTPYWLPEKGDTWRSEPRFMKELGPLPEGAVTTRPEKNDKELQKEALEETIRESESLLSATDYRILKFMDKVIKDNPDLLAKFNAEYPNTLEERQGARDNINGAQATASAANISLE